jgi:hypothetical protein
VAGDTIINIVLNTCEHHAYDIMGFPHLFSNMVLNCRVDLLVTYELLLSTIDHMMLFGLYMEIKKKKKLEIVYYLSLRVVVTPVENSGGWWKHPPFSIA